MRLHTPALSPRDHRGGYVIFAVLIVIVVLSLVAYRFTDSMTAEYRAGVRSVDDAQAKAAAISGLHYAAAVLSDRATFYEELDGNPYDNPDIFEQFEVVAGGGTGTQATKRAFFSIRCVALNDSGTPEQRFGVIDEGGKLNINSLIMLDKTGQMLYYALMKLEPLGMTEDLADSIVDWVDADDDARPAGAESSYYQSMSSPYKAKNGPLNSLDELLLVKGMSPTLLYGGDTNRNGVQDEGEVDDTRGLADYLTVYGRELNVDMSGTARIYLNGDNLETLYQQLEQAVGSEMATYVVASKILNPQRVPTQTATITTSSDGKSMNIVLSAPQPAGGNQKPPVPASMDQLYQAIQTQLGSLSTVPKRIRSALDLVGTQITLPRLPGTPQDAPDLVAYSPLNDPEKMKELLPKLMDKTTVRQAIEMVPRINVNTAPREVLLAIVNRNGESILTEEEIDAIMTNRAAQFPTDPATVTGAWLVTTNTISATKFRQLERYLTGSTMVYRVQAIGYLEGGGPVARFEAVIDTNQGAPRFLHIRDLSDLENPRGFPPPTVLNQ